MSIFCSILRIWRQLSRPILLLFALILVSIPVHAASKLPDLGQDAATIISPYEERRIGEDAMSQIRRWLNFVDDPELTHYINKIGKRLTNQLLEEQRDFRFFLIDHQAINAFALPGGFIGIHTGLITSAASESELASVLAHEIVHVTQRHWPRMMAAQKKRSGLTMAAILASLVLAGTGDINAGGIAVAALAADIDSRLAFTRNFEREADRIGIRLLAEAKLDAKAMAIFFERLAAANRYNGSDSPEFMRTHPVTNNRIAEARNNATRFPEHKGSSSSDFYHFRARIRAYYQTDPRQSLAIFSAKLKQKNIAAAERQATQYGIALVHLRLGNFGPAGKTIDRLRRQKPGELRYQLAQADIALAAGRQKPGMRLYQQIYNRNRTDYWVTRRYAENLLAHHQQQRALDVLRPVLKKNPRDAALNKLMAKAAGETGDLVQAHRAMAEYYIINGNIHEAINQLGIAEKKAQNDYYALTAIRARIIEIKASGAKKTTNQ